MLKVGLTEYCYIHYIYNTNCLWAPFFSIILNYDIGEQSLQVYSEHDQKIFLLASLNQKGIFLLFVAKSYINFVKSADSAVLICCMCTSLVLVLPIPWRTSCKSSRRSGQFNMTWNDDIPLEKRTAIRDIARYRNEWRATKMLIFN